MSSIAMEVISFVLLFFLIGGMSATVKIRSIRAKIANYKALLIGIALQFFIMPFLGFLVVKMLNMDPISGLMLLIVTSSPGGSFSNWWCSLFNADLALSVTMTACSTILSTFMLPLNLLLYAQLVFSEAVLKNIDWGVLFLSLGIVVGGILAGLFAAWKVDSVKFHKAANLTGNVAGLSLLIISFVVSQEDDDGGGTPNVWHQSATFYIGVAIPCVIGLVIAIIVCIFLGVKKPELVAISVECCYQNTGIASSIALTMYDGSEEATAIGVPLFYGLLEAILLGVFCLVSWQLNWTKAPRQEKICVVLLTSYEIEEEISKFHADHDIDLENVEVEVAADFQVEGDDEEEEEYEEDEEISLANHDAAVEFTAVPHRLSNPLVQTTTKITVQVPSPRRSRLTTFDDLQLETYTPANPPHILHDK